MNIGFQTSGLSGFTRVAYLWRRHASAVLWIAMAALLPTACSDDAEQSVPQANGHTAVIYLNFKTGASKQAAEMNTSQSSETRAPLTRAIDENGINTVDVLSFKVDPADPTYKERYILLPCTGYIRYRHTNRTCTADGSSRTSDTRGACQCP